MAWERTYLEWNSEWDLVGATRSNMQYEVEVWGRTMLLADGLDQYSSSGKIKIKPWGHLLQGLRCANPNFCWAWTGSTVSNLNNIGSAGGIMQHVVSSTSDQ